MNKSITCEEARVLARDAADSLDRISKMLRVTLGTIRGKDREAMGARAALRLASVEVDNLHDLLLITLERTK